MPGLSAMATALLLTLFPLAVQASAPLPDVAAVQAAARRAIEAAITKIVEDEKESPGPNASMFLGRMRLVEVVGVHGCVPLQAEQLNCIISFDEGFGQIRYRPLPLQKIDGQWEILPGHQDRSAPAPPIPTAAQAQAALQAYAREQMARGVDDEELRQIADGTGFLAPSLSDCRLNEAPFVTCDVDSSWPAASGGTQIRSGRMEFRLIGTGWHLYEAPPDPVN